MDELVNTVRKEVAFAFPPVLPRCPRAPMTISLLIESVDQPSSYDSDTNIGIDLDGNMSSARPKADGLGNH